MAETYEIVRFYQKGRAGGRVLRRGVSLEEAQRHCNDPETSSKTALSREGKSRTKRMGAWFDGYRRE